METVAVIGAAGAMGRKVCAAATARGLTVVAVDQADPDLGDAAGVRVVRADVLADDLAPALDGCDAVVSTLGLHFSLENAVDPPPLYTQGTANLIRAMRTHGCTRLVVVSAAFVQHQRALPLWFEASVVPALHSILEQMRSMERAIAAEEDLDWTIARPGWLLDAPAKGDLLANDETLAPGAFRCREADLAAFLVDIVIEGTWIGQRPALGAPDTHANESPLALGRALKAMLPAIGG